MGRQGGERDNLTWEQIQAALAELDRTQVRTDTNGVTLSVKLADLHWEHGASVLERGAMGLLRWHNREQHSFIVLNDLWLKEYNIHTWRDL